MFRYIKKKPVQPITLREHYERRNKVLIQRKLGGHGDIIMQRMMFEDLSKIADITYCCPRKYLPFADNHPYAKTVAIEDVNVREYGMVYDVTTACRVHESKLGPKNDLNRSDIWAKHLGITLENHEPYFQVKNTELYKNSLYEINTKKLPMVLLATKSTSCDFGIAKSMTDNQVYQLCKSLVNQGFFVFTVHNTSLELFTIMNIPQFTGIELEAWAGLVSASDYVISIDTGTFHLAGALKKPLVGVFSFTDGKLYGKYYDFELVQKHRDNGDWPCGPCFHCVICPKTKDKIKPCMSELTTDDIMKGFEKLLKKHPYTNSTTTPASSNNLVDNSMS